MAETAILLSIKAVFAERILAGEKLYELRKSAPRKKVTRVYLYVSGGQGVVGSFEVGQIISRPIDELWSATGEAGTSHDRFYRYFEGRSRGHAISVLNPVRFSQPIFPDDLRKAEARFTAPQGFLYIEAASKIGRLLDGHRRKQADPHGIALYPLQKANAARYICEVTREIAPRYDDITENFAKNIVDIHFRTLDQSGVNTAQKEVLEVYENAKLVGFTTLTHKYGFSTKSGPSVIFKSLRHKGRGQRMRQAVDDHCRKKKRGKLYCTCPDNELELVAHLLASGYRIEGHLPAHYKPDRGEFILGKQLRFPLTPAEPLRFSDSQSYKPEEFGPSKRDLVTSDIDRWSSLYWGVPRASSPQRVINILKLRSFGDKDFEEKGVGGYFLKRRGRTVGICCLMPKRGGSVKIMYFCASSDRRSFSAVLECVERVSRKFAKRKLYTIVPMHFSHLVELFRAYGFQGEGLMRQAYSENCDAIVMGKFL